MAEPALWDTLAAYWALSDVLTHIIPNPYLGPWGPCKFGAEMKDPSKVRKLTAEM